MDKSPDAFRTISEVAEVLDTPAHVLRFWESRFPQVRPVKRAGGRRYYRPSDVALLAGIRRLLHDEGMTIRGVQKVLREQGVRHVAALAGGEDAAPDLDIDLDAMLGDEAAEAEVAETEAEFAEPEAEAEAEVAEPETEIAEAGEPEPAGAAAPAAPEKADAPPAPAPSADDLPLFAAPLSRPAPGPAPDPAPDAAAEDGRPTLAARLRALPPGALAARAEDIAPLRDRLAALQAAMAARGGLTRR